MAESAPTETEVLAAIRRIATDEVLFGKHVASVYGDDVLWAEMDFDSLNIEEIAMLCEDYFKEAGFPVDLYGVPRGELKTPRDVARAILEKMHAE